MISHFWTTAFDGSRTVPTKEPKVDCPNNAPAKPQTRMTNATDLKLTIRFNVGFSLTSFKIVNDNIRRSRVICSSEVEHFRPSQHYQVQVFRRDEARDTFQRPEDS